MDEEEIEKLILRNGALLTIKEGKFLFELAKKCKGDIVEIGSYLGGSTVILAKGLKNPFKIYSIDSHMLNSSLIKRINKHLVPKNPLEVFLKNIKRERVEQKVIHIVKTSEEAVKNWKRKFSLLWIDGDHEYKGVKKDFLLWESFLMKGGLIALHDSHYGFNQSKEILPATGTTHFKYEHGPIDVVEENIKKSDRFKIIKIVDTITCALKIKNSGLAEKLNNQNALRAINGKRPLLFSKIILEIDRLIGLFGIFIKKVSPKTYYFLKIIKYFIFKK